MKSNAVTAGNTSAIAINYPIVNANTAAEYSRASTISVGHSTKQLVK